MESVLLYTAVSRSAVRAISRSVLLSFMLQFTRFTSAVYTCKMLYISSYNVYLTFVNYVKDVHSLCTSDGALKSM